MASWIESEKRKKFGMLMGKEQDHVRVDVRSGDQVVSHGSAWQLHGPEGSCICCYGRADESS